MYLEAVFSFYVLLYHFVGHSFFGLIAFRSLSDIIKRNFSLTFAKLNFYVDMSVWLFVGKQYYRLDVSTNSNDIPTKFRKYGQYLYSTNTARVSLFPQNHVLSSSVSKTLHSYNLFLKLGIIHI